MKIYGRGTIHDILGDLVVYRSLTPADDRLPGFAEIAAKIGLDADCPPRKSDTTYGVAVSRLLCLARRLEAQSAPIRRIFYIGDTRMNDGLAFKSICHAGQWPGIAFIGCETAEPARLDIEQDGALSLVFSNRWSALRDAETIAQSIGLAIDEHTAVVIDLDKTALGARGRNDAVIDRVRVNAAQRTVSSLLGDGFDVETFQAAYDRLNQPEYHPFTADNQDYLVYVCLILGTGFISLDVLLSRICRGTLAWFDQFLEEVDDRASRLPEDVRTLHRRFRERVARHDPTPFKAFRRCEYLETAGRMGSLPDDAPVKRLMQQEITLTEEVREVAARWRERGALLFGLSDKPDEACYPTDEQAAVGLLPLHRMETHAVGE
ncbi:hypothetical protein KAJ02_06000 [Candidatus Bipolaricaulota bacterium]|nr:hypothetical protein [Candidatus Bipolaricaulota bacterium]